VLELRVVADRCRVAEQPESLFGERKEDVVLIDIVLVTY
jgi:hypothetical protein